MTTEYHYEECPECHHNVRVDARRFAVHYLSKQMACRGSTRLAPSKMTWQEREAFDHHDPMGRGGLTRE